MAHAAHSGESCHGAVNPAAWCYDSIALNPSVSALSLTIAWSLLQASGAEEPSPSTGARLRETMDLVDSLPGLIASEQVHGRIGFYGTPRDPNHLVIDLGRSVIPDEVVLFPARLPTDAPGNDAANGFPPELVVEIADEATFTRPIRLARWHEESPGAGTTLPFLRLSGNGAGGRFVRVSIMGSRERSTGRGNFFTLGEIVVLGNGANLALQRPVTTTASIENAPRWQVSNLTDGYLWCLPLAGKADSASNGYHSLIETKGDTPPKWVEVDLGKEFPIDEIHLIPAHPRDFADTAGFGFPPRFQVTGRDESGTGYAFYDSGEAPFPNPGAAAVILPGGKGPVRYLRIEANELWRRTEDYIFALAELQAWSAGENIALGKDVIASDSTETGLWSTAALTDGFSSRHELLSWTTWLDATSEREHLQSRAAELTATIAGARDRYLRQGLYAALLLVVLIALGAVIVLLVQRRRAALANEELKRRIAADLHDELGASLSHLALQSDLARSRVDADDPVAERLASLSDSARETLDNMRDVVWLLAPVAGSWSDLESRLENIAERLLEDITHRFEKRGLPPAGNPPLEWAREIVLFLKESLTNARKHAGATSIGVQVIWSAAGLTMHITDNGSGFDPLTTGTGRGRGLLNFQTRAKVLGGTCRLESAPGAGTAVIIEIPLPRP
jgi:signal transduction histidine kinase